MPYGCEIWPLRVEDQCCLEVYDNDRLCRILGRRRRDRVPHNTLRYRLHILALPQRSYNAGSDGSDMLLAVPQAKSRHRPGAAYAPAPEARWPAKDLA